MNPFSKFYFQYNEHIFYLLDLQTSVIFPSSSVLKLKTYSGPISLYAFSKYSLNLSSSLFTLRCMNFSKKSISFPLALHSGSFFFFLFHHNPFQISKKLSF